MRGGLLKVISYFLIGRVGCISFCVIYVANLGRRPVSSSSSSHGRLSFFPVSLDQTKSFDTFKQ